MAGRGPAPKPAHLRQRTNRKAGATVIEAPDGKVTVPGLSHPNDEPWHPSTVKAWREFFESPMSTQWLATDITGLEMLAVCYDKFYKTGDVEYMKEIRLQRPCFGLTPLDRSRLQWEVSRAEEAEKKRPQGPAKKAAAGGDPRRILSMVKGKSA